MKNLILVIALLVLALSQNSIAAPGITYHGRLLRSDSTPVDGQFVGFKIRVMDGSTGACEMYQETHTKDMRLSNGAFSISVGEGIVVGSYNVAGVGLFDELFKNDKTFNFSTGPCAGTPYVAGSKDGRKLFVQFRESPAASWEDLPLMSVAFVPFAYSSLVSKKVGEFESSNILRVENAGAPGAAMALTSANMTELMALLGGTTTQYIKSVVGTAGEISASNTAGAVSLSLPNTAVTAGTYGSSTQVPVFTVDAKGRITSVTNTAVSGGGGGITDLTGDVTATGPGSAAATIANNAVTTAKINNLAVDDTKLAANSVITAKILDANVTLNKLAADSVNSAKIVDNSITGADILSTAALSVASVTATGNVGAGTMSTRSIGLFELPGNGTESITLQAPAALAGNIVYTLPATDGASGDVLSTNSAGVLSWVTPGSPGNATFAAKGVVQFDTDAATSGITVAAGVAKIATGGVATAMIADDAVSFAKLQNIATNKLLGRGAALSGDVEEITLGTGLSFAGTTLNATVTDSFAALPCGNGYLPYKDAGAWTCKQVTSANTNDAIITRDSSGNFIAGTGQFSTSVKITDGAAGGQVTIAAPGTFASYNLTLPVDDGGVDQVLKTNGSGVLSWVNQPTVTGMIVDAGNATGAEIVIGTNDAQKLSFETGNAKAMTIDTSGKVGIGTATPYQKLDVQGTDSNVIANIQNNSSTAARYPGILVQNYSGGVGGSPTFGGLSYRGSSGSPAPVESGDSLFTLSGMGATDSSYGSATGAQIQMNAAETFTATALGANIAFLTAEAGSASLLTRMTILNNGNVGIGTTPTNGKLEVKGSIVMDGATSGYVGFQPDANAGSIIYTLPSADGGNGDVLKTNGSGVLSWTTIAGGGEANTASNVGAGGVGIYKSKTGVNIDLKNINAGSNKITVNNDAGNNEVDIDIAEANLTLDNLGGTLGLAKGGTSANIPATNGGVIYSTATAMAVTAPGSAGQMLQSAGAASPVWTTATYPATTAVNQLLYSSAANTLTGLTTGNNGVLVTSAGGVPSISSTLPNAVQDNITRAGTIVSGTWSGTAIAADKGGTGQTTYTVGDILYASTSSALSRLPAGATAGHVLTSNGSGAAPSWQAAGLPGPTIRFTRTNISYNASNTIKNNQCVTEYGAGYQAAAILDLAANWNATSASPFDFVAYGVAGSEVNQTVSVGVVIFNVGGSGSSAVACVSKSADILFTRATASYNSSNVTKDNACTAEYGSVYQAATVNDLAANWKTVSDTGYEFVAANYTTAEVDQNVSGGTVIFSSGGTGSSPVACTRK